MFLLATVASANALLQRRGAAVIRVALAADVLAVCDGRENRKRKCDGKKERDGGGGHWEDKGEGFASPLILFRTFLFLSFLPEFECFPSL